MPGEQREIFDDAALQSQRDAFAEATVDQYPLNFRRNSVYAHAGDIAIVRGRHADVPVVIEVKRGSVARVRGFAQKDAPKRFYNVSSLWVITRHNYPYVTIFRARSTPDPHERWVVDVHTGEMIRVANLYDVWILEQCFYNELAWLRRRYRLVDAVAWMTGDELDVLRAEKSRLASAVRHG